MAKSGILFYFTNTASHYNGRLVICVRDSSDKRRYQLIDGLVDPDYSKWDRKLQLFNSTTKESLANAPRNKRYS